MEDILIQLLESHNLVYVKIDNELSLRKIYQLFSENTMFEPDEAVELFYMGTYHFCITEDCEQGKKCYLMAIEKGNSNAMYNLAYIYGNIEKDYDQAKKYYLMAVEKGNSRAMYNVAYIYDDEQNYEQAKKYYLMAVEKGNSDAMNNLAYIYDNIEHDYEQAKKYYLMAIEKGDSDSMHNLVELYNDQKMYFEKMALMIKYNELTTKEAVYKSIVDVWNSCLTNDNKKEFIELVSEFEFAENDINDNNFPVSLILFISAIKNQLSIMDLHFTYTVEGKGFSDAKKDYLELVGAV